MNAKELFNIAKNIHDAAYTQQYNNNISNIYTKLEDAANTGKYDTIIEIDKSVADKVYIDIKDKLSKDGFILNIDTDNNHMLLVSWNVGI